jgi:hypothetical protein
MLMETRDVKTALKFIKTSCIEIVTVFFSYSLYSYTSHGVQIRFCISVSGFHVRESTKTFCLRSF